MNNKKERLITGPTYVLRLEGYINNIKKVVYLFGEAHLLREKCKNINSEKVKDYFARTLKTNKQIDFYLEEFINNKIGYYQPNTFAELAISELRYFLQYHYHKKDYTNVRFQIIDIRDIYARNESNAYIDLLEIFENENISGEKFKYIKVDDYNKSKRLLTNIIKKLKSKYNHNSVKTTLTDHLTTIYNYCRGIRILNKIANDYNSIDINTNDGLISIQSRQDLLYIFAFLMDLYAMRRFLDKDYVTTAIFYTGHLHTSNYLHILIKDFGFTITHISNEPDKNNVADINKALLEHNIDYYQDFLIVNPTSQCCDINHFPEDYN